MGQRYRKSSDYFRNQYPPGRDNAFQQVFSLAKAVYDDGNGYGDMYWPMIKLAVATFGRDMDRRQNRPFNNNLYSLIKMARAIFGQRGRRGHVERRNYQRIMETGVRELQKKYQQENQGNQGKKIPEQTTKDNKTK